MKGSTCLLVASLIVSAYAAPFETSGWRGLQRHREGRGSDKKEVDIVDELLDTLDSTDIETLRLLLSKWDDKNDDGTDDNDFDEKKCRKCYNRRRTCTNVNSSESSESESESSDNSDSSSSDESERRKSRKKESKSNKQRNKSKKHRDANECESDENRLKKLIQKVQQKREQSRENKNFNRNGKRNSSLADLYKKLHRLVKNENRQYGKNGDWKKQNLIYKLNERRQKLLRACDITEDDFDKPDWIKQSARDRECLIELVILKIKSEVLGSGTWSSNDFNGSGSRSNGLGNGNNSLGSDSNDSDSDSNDSDSDSNDSGSDSNDSGSDSNESGSNSNESGNDSNDSDSDSTDSNSNSNESGSDSNESENDSNGNKGHNSSGKGSNGPSKGNNSSGKGNNGSDKGHNGSGKGNNGSGKGNDGSGNSNKGSGIGGRIPGNVNGSSGNSHTTETTPQPGGAAPGTDTDELGKNNSSPKNSTNKSGSEVGNWDNDRGNLLDLEVGILVGIILQRNAEYNNNSTHNSTALLELKPPSDLNLDLELGSEDDMLQNESSNSSSASLLYLNVEVLLCRILGINNAACKNSTNKSESLFGLKLPIDHDLDLGLGSGEDNALNGISDNGGVNLLDLEVGMLVGIILQRIAEYNNNFTNISQSLLGLKLPTDLDLDLGLGSDGDNELNGTWINGGGNLLDLEVGILVGIILQRNAEYNNNSTNNSAALLELKLPIDRNLDLGLGFEDDMSQNTFSESSSGSLLYLNIEVLLCTILGINNAACNNSTTKSGSLLGLPVDLDQDLEFGSGEGNSLNGTSNGDGGNLLDLEVGILVGIILQRNEEYNNNSNNISQLLPGLKLPMDLDLDLGLESLDGESQKGSSNSSSRNVLDVNIKVILCTILGINNTACNNSTTKSGSLLDLKLPIALDLDLGLGSDEGKSLNGTSDNNGDNSLDLEDGTLTGIILEINEEFHNNSTNISESLSGLNLPMGLDLDLGFGSEYDESQNGSSNSSSGDVLDLNIKVLVCTILGINNTACNNYTNKSGSLYGPNIPVDLGLDLGFGSNEEMSQNGTWDNRVDHLVDLEVGILVGAVLQRNEEFHNKSTNISAALLGLKPPIDLDLDLDLGSESNMSQNETSDSSSGNLLELDVEVLLCTILGIINAPCNNSAQKSGSLFGLNLPVELGLDLALGSKEDMSQNETSENGGGNLVDLEVGILVGIILQRNQEYINNSTHQSAASLGLKLPIDLDLGLGLISEDFGSQNGSWNSSSGNVLDLNITILLCTVLGINNETCKNFTNISELLLGLKLPPDLDLDLGLDSDENSSLNGTSDNNGGNLLDLEVGILIGIILQRNEEYHSNSTHKSGSLLGLKLPTNLVLDLDLDSNDDKSQNETSDSSSGNLLELDVEVLLCTILGINNVVCKNFTNKSGSLFGLKLPVDLDLALGLHSNEYMSQNGTWDNDRSNLLDLEVGILIGIILQRNQEYNNNSTHKSGSLLGLTRPIDLDLELGSDFGDDESQNETSDSSIGNLLYLDVGIDEEDKFQTETNEIIDGDLVGQEIVAELDIILYQSTDCSNSTGNCDFEDDLTVSRELDVYL